MGCDREIEIHTLSKLLTYSTTSNMFILCLQNLFVWPLTTSHPKSKILKHPKTLRNGRSAKTKKPLAGHSPPFPSDENKKTGKGWKASSPPNSFNPSTNKKDSGRIPKILPGFFVATELSSQHTLILSLSCPKHCQISQCQTKNSFKIPTSYSYF